MLETEIDRKIVSYGQLSTLNSSSRPANPVDTLSTRPTSSSDAQSAEIAIESQLRQLSQLVDALAAYLDRQYPGSSGGASVNPSMQHMLQRHRDVLYDYNKEFKRMKYNAQAMREHASLLGSVQNDINQYKNEHGSSQQDMLLNERRKVDGVHRLADSVVEAAYTARASLLDQRTNIVNSSRRVGGVLSRIPGINTLMVKIQARKRRDALIMGGVVAFCIIVIFLYIRAG